MNRSGTLGLAASVYLCAAAFFASAALALTNDQLPTSGINVAQVLYYGTQWLYADAVRMSRPTWTGPGTVTVPQNAEGYPASVPAGSFARTSLFQSNGRKYPLGQYVLKWKGTGDVEVTGGTTLVSTGDHRKVYNVTSTTTSGMTLRITRSDAADPVRDIQLWMPGTENLGSIFHPLFKERLKPFGVIRFMDALRTNNNPLKEWSDRTLPNHRVQTSSKGIAYEHAIDLCNELDKDLWINVPHAASADFRQKLAALVKARLDPTLRVWVEYSNETWNSAGGFKAQHDFVAARASQWGLTHNQAHARLSIETFAAFEQAFAGQRSRLVHVMGGQAARASILWDRIGYVKAQGKTIDVAAIAPYFTDGADTQFAYDHRFDDDWGAIYPEVRETITRKANGEWKSNASAARSINAPLIAFEFNQSLRAARISTEPYFVIRCQRITRDPRMYDIYRFALDEWRRAGGQTPVGYAYVMPWDSNGQGQFGHLEYQDQPIDQAPLYKALADWTVAKAAASSLTPVIKATPAQGAAPLAVQFDGSASTHAGPGIRTYFWNLGDGTKVLGDKVNHTYARPGNYTVTFTVIDYNGNSAYTTTQVRALTPGGGTFQPFTIQAETATLAGNAKKAKYHAGFTGAGYVDFASNNSSATWTINVPAAGSYILRYRYAYASGSNRTLELAVNGATSNVTFNRTNWTSWVNKDIPVTLRAGANTIRLRTLGQDGPNLDTLTVTK